MANYYHWKAPEILFLANHYPSFGSQWVAKHLEIPPNVIRAKANKMGLRLTHQAIIHRNTQNSRKHKPKPYKFCPQCGRYRSGRKPETGLCGYCTKATRERIWSKERLKFLAENYPTKGAKWTAQALGLTYKQVLSGASTFHIKYTDEARHRLVGSLIRERMQSDNPMWRPEVRKKVSEWLKRHPDNIIPLWEGQARIRRDKPSRPQARLYEILDSIGVFYRPEYLVKPKFIVDCLLPDPQIIIQVDGEWWHGHPRFEPLRPRQLAQRRRDGAQDAYLTKCGYRVVRFWESEINRTDFALVLIKVLEH